MPKVYSDINTRIKNELIPWCVKNNKKLYELPNKDENGNQFSLYTFVRYIRNHINLLNKTSINLLNENGMPWNKNLIRKKYECKVFEKRLKEELVNWSIETKLPLTKLPTISADGTTTLYYLLNEARNRKKDLSIELINLLDKHGMPWQSSRLSLDERCEKYLINWHKETGIPLNKMTYQKGKYSANYQFRSFIKVYKPLLKPETIAELDKAGMDWTITTNETLDERINKHLIKWHKETRLPLSEMPEYVNKKIFYPYILKCKIRKLKFALLPETIVMLNEAGMDWEPVKKFDEIINP